MTPIQACKETKELWTEMARFAREEKRLLAKSEIIGPWEGYKCHCPCCEYTRFTDCFSCPMREEWTYYTEEEDTPCEGLLSPYDKWRFLRYNAKILCIDVEFFCLLIADLAEEAEMKHIAKSQPTFAEDKDIDYIQVNKVKN